MNIIEKSAEFILKNKQLDNIILVFPSRRASVYFKNAVLKIDNQKPVILPKIFSISEFIEYYSNMETIDINEGVIILYKIYKNIGGEENFESFFHLGRIILKDFADIDRMIINENNVKHIFKNLREISLLEQKDIINNAIIKKHIKSMEEYGILYEKFLKYMEKNKKCYSGMCYKYAYNNILNIGEKLPEIFFIGFNALTNIEKMIFTELKKIKKAYFIWDSDLLIEEDKNLSGYFLKNNVKEFSPIIEYDNLLKNKKNVNIISTSINTDMTLIMKNILMSKYKEKIPVKDIGIILMDENILSSVLYALPEEYKEFNITMGYSLKNTGVFEILKTIFDMHIYKIKIHSDSFYIKFLKSIINNPYMIFYLKEKNIYKKIKEYINQEENSGNYEISLPLHLIKNTDFVFNYFKNSNELFLYLENFLKDMSIVFKDSIDQEYVFYIMDKIHEIKEYFDLISDISINIILKIILSILESLNIPFRGEPIKGLQIMGLLESRLLSFKHLIILSVNDNFLPGKGNDMSLIPIDVKKQYGIFSNKEKDAIFAYHFFRLLKYAENIDIIHAEQTDSKIGVSMRSRFIDYILWNNKRKKGIGNNWNINEYVYSNDNIVKKEPRKQKKDSLIIEQLNNIHFSSTSLITYLKCPYRFYLYNILKINKERDYTEEMDNGTFGLIIHSVLEYLYRENGKNIYNIVRSSNWNEYYIQLCKKAVENNKRIPNFNIEYGKNKLMIDAGRILIENILENEFNNREDLDFNNKILYENRIDNIELKNNNNKVFLKGIIDRLEIGNNEYIVIDYKTRGPNGKIEFKFLEDWQEQKESVVKNEKAFQLLFYLFLEYKQNDGKNKNRVYKAYNYFLSKNKIVQLTVDNEKVIDKKIFGEFEKLLLKIIEEIFDQTKEFIAIDDDGLDRNSVCKYCDFESICKLSVNIKK